MATTATKGREVNGLDVDAIHEMVRAIEQDPAQAQVEFRVRSEWKPTSRSSCSAATRRPIRRSC
jgi:hypothetical protein